MFSRRMLLSFKIYQKKIDFQFQIFIFWLLNVKQTNQRRRYQLALFLMNADVISTESRTYGVDGC